jgi:AraC-like DNA-binding protein
VGDSAFSSRKFVDSENLQKMYYYQEYKPDIRLTPWVKNYWLAIDFVSGEVTPKVFPDGCTNVIFEFDKTKGISYANLFGTTTTFIEVNMPKSTQMFGISFRPLGITAFTRIPVNEFTDRAIELESLETLFDNSFCERLPEKQSVEDMITHTNNYLVNQLPRLYFPDKRIIRAMDLISLTKGQLNFADLASEVCLCQRHFERKFKSAIGVSPKTFAKIFRFKHVLQCLGNYPHKNLLTIAEEYGYYDHTHLINDFKTLSGDTPTDFRQKKSIFYTYGVEYIE